MSSPLVFPFRLRGVHCLSGLLIGLLLCSGYAQAQGQVFKWVGPDGKVNYGDSPPANQRAEKKSLTANVFDNSSLPFAVAEAARLHPVTFIAAKDCAPCDAGRRHLEARGIPFTEKSVATNADIALLGAARAELPQLTIGRDKLTGFDAGAWDARLSAAGYPASNKLSSNHRNPPPSALAPTPAEATGPKDADDGVDAQATSAAAAQRPARAKAPPKPPAQPRTDGTLPGLRF